MRARAAARWRPWLWGLILAAVLWYVLAFALHGWNLMRFPYEADYGEGAILNEAMRLAAGAGVYVSDRTPPYLVGNYPPVYLLLVAALRLAGARGFAAGRALSALSVLAAAALAGLTVRQVLGEGTPPVAPAGRSFSAALAAGLICAQNYIWQWGPLERVDSLALAWSLAGLYAVARRPERAARAWPWFLLAVLTRQSEVAALAGALWYLWPGRRAQALGLGLRWAAGLAVAVAGLQWATGGHFLVQIVVDNANHYSLLGALGSIGGWLFTAGGLPLILFAVWGLALTHARPKGRLLVGYAVAAWLIVWTVGKVGSSLNYFFPTIAAAAMLAALVPHAPRRPGLAAVTIAAFLIGIPPLANRPGLAGQVTRDLTAFHDLRTPTYNRLGWVVPVGGQDPEDARLIAVMRRTQGPILARDMGDILQSGHAVFFQPFELTQVAANGHWNPAPLIQRARLGGFPLVVLDFPLAQVSRWDTSTWPPAFLRTLSRHYRLAGRIGDYWLYRPLRPR